MRIWGFLKIFLILALDGAVAYFAAGPELAVLVTGGILAFAWLGEYIDILKDGAIRAEKLSSYDRERLEAAKASLVREVQDTVGADISRVRFRLLPDSNQINAYAYGLRNIGVTKAALDASDAMTLNAVLGHEISHILSMDAVFNRVVFANMTLVLASMGLGCAAVTCAIWLMLALPSLFSNCGCVGIHAANGISGLIRKLTNGLQHLFVAVYQAGMGLISRGSEYRADAFSAELGYGDQLAYFLERFVAPNDGGRATLRELLYNTHPQPYKRIHRLERFQQRQLQRIAE